MDAAIQERIAHHAATTRKRQSDAMNLDVESVESQLDETIVQLQARVNEHQQALEMLLASSKDLPTRPSDDPRERLQQLRVVKLAYNKLRESRPLLPAYGSIVPTVLAAHVVKQTVDREKSAIEAMRQQLSGAISQAERESNALRDASLLSSALETRIQRLQNQRDEHSRKEPAKVAHDMLKEAQRKKKTYQHDIQRLQLALDHFVDDQLAAMVAAEELGGPVVGNIIGVDENVLMGGFSSQGRVKKSANVSEDKRQRRIDQIWGAATRDGAVDEPTTEKEASAYEIKELFTSLYDALVRNDSPGPFIELSRDSAAARFLVRAKVAQFHPKDARRLKMIDFGRELDE